jgi:site-specific DNA-methyltransferase (adenine-specific)
MNYKKSVKTELFNDNFQNYKRYSVPKAQLVIADIPYNLGVNFYGSNPMWYIDGDNKNGESKYAKKAAFNTDFSFNIAEYMHFCSKLLIKVHKEKGKAPAMIVFCAFDQMQTVMEYGKKHGFENSYPIFFIKNYSAQVLKANMKIVGATEHAVVLYRDKLPKFNNNGKMIFNCIDWEIDNKTEKIHPTQKPVPLLEKLIKIFTDEGDVVIDPVAGS